MRVFITGASGWIGSAAVDELLAHDYEVLGLARSDASAAALEAKGSGITVLRGDLDDLDSLRRGATETDATLHLANKHDFAHPGVSDKAERAAVETIGEALVGTNKKFLLASGIAGAGTGAPLTENDASPFIGPDSPRGGSENRALDFVSQGVGTVSLRFAPTVHGVGDHGFIALITGAAKRNGVSGYVGEGSNSWAAVHRSDAARLIRLGLEKAAPGTLLHAIGEQGVPTRAIAEAIGAGLGLPVESITAEAATAQLGMIGTFFGMDVQASSAITRELLGWEPSGPTLLDDIAAGAYFG